MILLGKARRPVFVIADTLAGAAPFGEDLTVVVVGGEERVCVCKFYAAATLLCVSPARAARALKSLFTVTVLIRHDARRSAGRGARVFPFKRKYIEAPPHVDRWRSKAPCQASARAGTAP